MGYSAKEIVELLQDDWEDFFEKTIDFNSFLVKQGIIRKEKEGYYSPMPTYSHLFLIDTYRGKKRGIKYTHKFIDWIKDFVKKHKQLIPEQHSFDL